MNKKKTNNIEYLYYVIYELLIWLIITKKQKKLFIDYYNFYNKQKRKTYKHKINYKN